MSQSTKTDKIYKNLLKRIKKISNIGHATGILRWDQEVMMPESGTPARAKQISTLSSLQHELFTEEKTGKLLEGLKNKDLSVEKEAVIREIKRQYERAVKVPNELIEEISRTSSEAIPEWRKAREKNDFSIFAPYLKNLKELKQKYASKIDPEESPYKVLFKDFEPYIKFERTESILNELRKELVPFIEKICNSEIDITREIFTDEYKPETQEKLVRDALDLLGFDWSMGRLDISPHPFTQGTQFDARITTRFQEDPLDAIMSAIHEFGHAKYLLGLPKEHYGTPLGESRDLTVHESQSRFWENHIGRSKDFWQLFLPKIKENIPSIEITVNEAYEAVNQVYEDNPIRVEADELTYHMHIVPRFEIEQEIMNNELKIKEIPPVWNEKMEKYLGVKPENDSRGCLQDIHWTHGSFGYFPTYSLGSVLSAQIYTAASREINNFNEKIKKGEFNPLHKWLRNKIHKHGQFYTTNQLIKKSTGKKLTSTDFIEYVKGKYKKIYEV